MAKFDVIVNDFTFKWQIQNEQRKIIDVSNSYFNMNSYLCFNSQKHCTNQVTGFPIRKLIAILLITFYSISATIFGNNFYFSLSLLIRKLLLDEAILLSCQPQNMESNSVTEVLWGFFTKRGGIFY